MHNRAKILQYHGRFMSQLLHAQRGGRDADVFLDGQAGIEEVRRLRHDTVRRPNHLGIDAIVRRIGYKVDAFTAKKPGCPRHMESTGYQNGLLPALLPADFFGESRVFCRIFDFYRP